ncbi:AbrB family transcriptional regulator [Bordetella bronchialis]|uniref:AbrB family transcriptional regulator n=1 Tax=Bordetella bronchialis TaxID=463025 RepID=UPI0009F39D8C|nr:AbrB family transcriptional regulator [Bordetella bronchialis]
MVTRLHAALRSTVFRATATYAGAALAGCLFQQARVPLPWMLGPLAFTAAASLAGLPVMARAALRNLGMTVVGTALGLSFTPEAARQLLDHIPLILAAVLATLLIACTASLLLTRTAGIDRVTAFFCSVPGGAAEMCLLAHRYGGAATPIAVAQMLRVVLLVIVLPAVLTWSADGGKSPVLPLAGTGTVDMPALAGLLIVSGIATLLMARAGMRSAWLLVPLAVGIAATLSGWTASAMPGPLASLAQVFIGTQLGAAFRRKDLLAVRRALPAIVLNVAILAGGCAGVAMALAAMSGAHPHSLVLATSPGGVTEMCLTARALGLEVPLIVGFHVCRVFVVLAATPWVFAAMRRGGLIEVPATAARST